MVDVVLSNGCGVSRQLNTNLINKRCHFLIIRMLLRVTLNYIIGFGIVVAQRYLVMSETAAMYICLISNKMHACVFKPP